MNPKIIEISPGQKLLPTIQEAASADHLFIAGDGELWQWSISQKKVTKNYGKIMVGSIQSMVQTSDKKYLFVPYSTGR
jgi:succinate dehydrogenase flavin-adding protein (antitoxin of CptAB toxin-antitoxin module)